MEVAQLIKRDIATLRRSDPLRELLRVLGESPQDVFPVLDEAERVVGTVSELDLVRVVSPSRRTFPFGPRKLVREGLVRGIEDVMTPRPSTTRPDEPVETALKRMSDLDLPQLVVVDDQRRLVGLLRGRDAYLALAESESEKR